LCGGTYNTNLTLGQEFLCRKTHSFSENIGLRDTEAVNQSAHWPPRKVDSVNQEGVKQHKERIVKAQPSHSPQPLGWGPAGKRRTGNHFNGLPRLAIRNHKLEKE